MSVEEKSDGTLRLRCDVAPCERKFVPRKRFTESVQLRLRAALYGWLTDQPDRDGRDRCPEHR